MFLEHLRYINCVPVSEFSLENVKIKMKLVVKYNLLKNADKKYHFISFLWQKYIFSYFFEDFRPLGHPGAAMKERPKRQKCGR